MCLFRFIFNQPVDKHLINLRNTVFHYVRTNTHVWVTSEGRNSRNHHNIHRGREIVAIINLESCGMDAKLIGRARGYNDLAVSVLFEGLSRTLAHSVALHWYIEYFLYALTTRISEENKIMYVCVVAIHLLQTMNHWRNAVPLVKVILWCHLHPFGNIFEPFN